MTSLMMPRQPSISGGVPISQLRRSTNGPRIIDETFFVFEFWTPRTGFMHGYNHGY